MSALRFTQNENLGLNFDLGNTCSYS